MSEYLQPGLHPDPDSLNAFVEGVLPEHERLQCLAHLACGRRVFRTKTGMRQQGHLRRQAEALNLFRRRIAAQIRRKRQHSDAQQK